MGASVHIDIAYEFAVKAPYKEVFDLLSDVPASVRHFPKVDQLVDLGGGVYRWEMAKVGTPQIGLQTVYASRYVSDRRKGSVVWTPVEGVGNAQVSGSWKITDRKGSTGLVLQIQGQVDTPFPGLMKPVVGPVVTGEFERLTERYIDNLIAHFGGEA